MRRALDIFTFRIRGLKPFRQTFPHSAVAMLAGRGQCTKPGCLEGARFVCANRVDPAPSHGGIRSTLPAKSLILRRLPIGSRQPGGGRLAFGCSPCPSFSVPTIRPSRVATSSRGRQLCFLPLLRRATWSVLAAATRQWKLADGTRSRVAAGRRQRTRSDCVARLDKRRRAS